MYLLSDLSGFNDIKSNSGTRDDTVADWALGGGPLNGGSGAWLDFGVKSFMCKYVLVILYYRLLK